MRTVTRMIWVWVLAGWVHAIAFPNAVAAQDDVTISKQQLEELKRQAAEAERLKKQLNDAQKEIQNLKGKTNPVSSTVVVTNVVVTNVVTAPVVRDADRRVVPIPNAVYQNIANQPPTPPLGDQPAITPDTVVTVNDLVTWYATQPEEAKKRFDKKTFSVRGIATDFRKPLFLSSYDVNFRLPNQSLYVNCMFRPPEEFRSYYVSRSGEEMIGETYNARTVFARVGADLTVRGYCEGVQDGYVRLGNCQYMIVPKGPANAPR